MIGFGGTRLLMHLLSCLCSRQGVEGIVNGMDVEEWDPRADKYLTVRYDKTNVHAGKAAAKAALQVRPDSDMWQAGPCQAGTNR
jgi:glycogen synthase